MPRRRSPLASGMGDGTSTGAAPMMAMPFTGTGTGDAYSADLESEQAQAMGGMGMMGMGGMADPSAESPATMRRRLMPVAGPIRHETGALDLAQHILQRRGV